MTNPGVLNRFNIIQRNCQGVRTKKNELLDLIHLYQPCIIALHETKLWTGNNLNLSGYNDIRKEGHYNRTPHGGVAIYVHQSIPYIYIYNIQSVAVQVHLNELITICSIYSSRSYILGRNFARPN